MAKPANVSSAPRPKAAAPPAKPDAPPPTAPAAKPPDAYRDGKAKESNAAAPPSPLPKPAEKANAKYDFVVVGSGPGGAPAAARLAENGYKVLLLEAGDDKAVPESEPLGLHARASENPDLLTRGTGEFIHHHTDLADDQKDSKFVPEKDGVFVPRGRGPGGSARMNAGILVAADDVDWNNIAKATGDDSWNAANMKQYFQKVEGAEYQPVLQRLHSLGKALGVEALQNIGGHSYDGWLKVNRPLDLETLKTLRDNPQLGRVLKETVAWSALNLGTPMDKLNTLRFLANPNVDQLNNREGFVVTPLTVNKDGRRTGPWDRLNEVQAKFPENLEVRTGARVQDFVLDENNEATAVRYRTPDGQMHVEPFKRELVLSAGAFETPAILMRSGIAPEDQRDTLAKNGIDLKVVRDGVGNHLKGRYEIGVVQRLKEPLPVLTETDFNADPNNPAYKKWKETGQGLFAGNGIVAAFRAKSDPSKDEPDLYCFAVPGRFQGYKPGYSKEAVEDPNLITWVILDENKGDSKGKVTLDPNDVNGRVKVNQMFHGDERPGDSRALVNGIKMIRQLSTRYGDILDKEEWPGAAVQSDSALAKAVEQNSWDHHPNGTAQIGAVDDPQSVVDKDLRLIGVKGVRVSDASIFRRNMGSFIQSAIYTVSEKAAAELTESAQEEDAAQFSPWNVVEPR